MRAPSGRFAGRVLVPLLLVALSPRLSEAQSFVRADANLDGQVDISDATTMLGCLFLGGDCPVECPKVADANDDGSGDIADPILLLGYLFLGGSPPPAPFPECGADPTPDGLPCRAYPGCEGELDPEEEGEGEDAFEPTDEDREGETPIPTSPPRESDDKMGRVELQFSAALPRGFDEVVAQVVAIEWFDESGRAHPAEVGDVLSLGSTGETRLPATELPAGTYVDLRIDLADVTLVQEDASRPLRGVDPIDVDFGRLRGVRIQSGRTTVVSVDLSFTDVPILGVLTAVETLAPVTVDPVRLTALETLERLSETPVRYRFDKATRAPRFAAGSWPTNPRVQGFEAKAIDFVEQNGALFLWNPDQDQLRSIGMRRTREGRVSVRLEQLYRGYRIFGADLVVHLEGERVHYFNGRLLSEVDLRTEQEYSNSRAAEIARVYVASMQRGIEATIDEKPELLVYNPSLRHPSLPDSFHLAYMVTIQTLNPGGRWLCFVDSLTGEVVDAWDSAMHLHNSRVLDANGTNSTSDDDEWFEDCVQQQTGAPPTEVAALETHQRNFYLFLQNRFAIDSIDDGGQEMIARANDPAATGLQACWDCRDDETVYLTGWVTGDVVAHEFTHGIVEELAGGLGSSVQARTLNEANADIFAELFDCRSGGCNWLVGTDYLGNAVPGGWVRDMANPTIGHMSDFNWSTTSPYVNIGIPSMVAYLLVQGDTHNGVSVGSIGLTKAERLFFATLADGGLSSSATFEEYREVMMEEAASLSGFTSWDRRQVYRAWLSVGIGTLTQPVVGALNESSDYFGWTLVTGNFNGDAYEDLAVGCPYEGYQDKDDSGVVFVFYGSSIGLRATGAETIAQNHLGGSSSANNNGDQFGFSLAVGNFNGDAYDDLAIGSPYENVGGQVDAGMVKIVYGTSSGLKQGNSTWWEGFTQAYANGAVEAHDRFGWSLAAGNFNGDAYDDLAVGTPYEHLGSTPDVGIVNAFYGSSQGLIRNDGTMSWEGFTQSLVGAANEANDRFGWALAAGNFNGGSYDDLAIGVPYEHIGSASDTGVVNIVYGSGHGLIRPGPVMSWERVSQSTYGAANEDGDQFGYSLAVGRFSNGEHDDLAIGSPGEDFQGVTNAGMVTVAYGKGDGLYPPGGWHRLAQSHAGGANESHDRFSQVLTAGNLNGDAWDELIVGVPLENAFGRTNNGVVSIFYSSAAGVYPSGWEWYGQSLTGGAEDDHDRYGWAVAAGDFDDDGDDDLAISAPWEDDPDGPANVGAIYVREY